MRASLTPAELAEMLAGLTRDETGMVCLEIPDACVSREMPRLILAAPNLVRYGDRHASLQPIPYAIVRYVMAHGPASFEELQDAIWIGQEVTDSAVKMACSRASERLFDAGIPFKVTATAGHVSIGPDE